MSHGFSIVGKWIKSSLAPPRYLRPHCARLLAVCIALSINAADSLINSSRKSTSHVCKVGEYVRQSGGRRVRTIPQRLQKTAGRGRWVRQRAAQTSPRVTGLSRPEKIVSGRQTPPGWAFRTLLNPSPFLAHVSPPRVRRFMDHSLLGCGPSG